MKANYKLQFEKSGIIKHSYQLMHNEVCIDIGDTLEMGVFVHHQSQDYDSTLMALVHNIKYLDNLLQSIESEKNVIINMHEGPDLDCIFCFYAIRFIVEHGVVEFKKFFNNKLLGEKLINYINDIDAGEGKDTSYSTLYALFSAIKGTDEHIVEKGIALLSLAVKEMKKNNHLDLRTFDFKELVKNEFSEEIELINQCFYDIEKESGAVKFEKISIWTKSNEKIDIPAAIWEKIPKDYLGYDHARKEGNVLTVIPYSIKGQNAAEKTRIFASINPDLDLKKEYSLKPLAEIIEQMEQIEELKEYSKTGIYRRNHGKSREENGYLSKEPFATTSDPWFISPKEDFVVSPRVKSILDYNDILEIIRNNGSALKKSYVLAVSEKPIVLYDKSTIPLSTWQLEVNRIVETSHSHLIIYGELDASLIRHSNDILKAYCLNLVGLSLHDGWNNNFLIIDYRTCIYVDLNCTIILVATYGNMTIEKLPIGKILKDSTLNMFKSSKIVEDLVVINKQREDLISFGNRIGELKFQKRKEIEELNERILDFSARVQKENMINNLIEREIYEFVQNEFGIKDLKSSIMDDMRILTEESRNKLVSKFNLLSAFAVPLILIATVFQMGIIKFDEIIHLTGVKAYIGWGMVLCVIAFVVITIMLAGKKRIKNNEKS